jgi:C-terminal processing protease CtpA/Prc
LFSLIFRSAILSNFTRVTIEKVEPGAKSERVGLQVGDVIIAHNGEEVADNQRFYELELIRGERARQLTIERAGRILTIDVPAGRLTGIETEDKAFAPEKSSETESKTRPILRSGTNLQGSRRD